MKKLIFLFQFFFIFSFSQPINWSEVYEQKNSGSKLNFIGKTSSEIFLMHQESKGFFSSAQKSVMIFDDSTLMLKKKILFDLDNNNPLEYIQTNIINNRLCAFYTKATENKTQLYSSLLNENKWGEISLVCSVPFSENAQVNINFLDSINSLLVYGVKKNELKRVNEFYATLINYNTKTETIFNVDLNSEYANLDFTQIKSDSNFNIILLANYFQKKSFNINTSVETPVAVKLNAKNNYCKIINLNSLDATTDFAFLINTNNGILLNRANGKPEISFVDFSEDISLKVLFNSESNKSNEIVEDYAIEKSSKNILNEKDFKNLKIRNVFREKDSTLVVVCEQNWTEQICNTLNFRFGGIQCFDYYYSMDLFVFYFSSDGTLLKMNKFQKPQVTIDDGGIYNSVVSLCKNKEILIVYNDEPSNSSRKIGRLKTMMYPMSSVLNSISLNSNGLLNSQRLSNPKQGNLIVRPYKSFYINSHEVLILATKSNKFKIGKIKL
jgi:hypothetical protein